MKKELSKAPSLVLFSTDILLFSAALVIIIITLVVIYIICGQSKLKTLVASIALQHINGIETADPRYQDIYCV